MKMPIKTGCRRTHARGVAGFLLCASLSLATWSAHACQANGENLIVTQSRVYSGYAAGAEITGWAATGSSIYLDKCDPDKRGTFTFSAAQSSVGMYDGYATFPTSNPSIGMQIRYQYPRGRRSADGTPIWSDWVGLSESPNTVTVATHLGFDLYTEYVTVRTEMRLVALSDISGDQHIGRTQIMQVDDESFGTTLHQKVFEKFDLWEPRAASCWFTGGQSQNVELPTTSTMMLRKEGDTGPAKTFRWSFRCDYGNLGQEPAMGIDYTAGTTATVPDEGRMSVTGGAQGVDLQVRRWNGSAMVPVRVGSSRDWVRWDAESGTEQLDVRYIRNADPLVPGEANGSLKIYIEPW